MHYLTKEDKDDWENLLEFEATLPDWDTFKEALFRSILIPGNCLYHQLTWEIC